MNKTVKKVTDRIVERSRPHREKFLMHMEAANADMPFRHTIPCSNLAHDIAACPATCKATLFDRSTPNIGIISGYNDLLSAHHTFKDYPEILMEAVAEAGGAAQFAGGVPAMCDGVTQGEPGMDLSLLSRDVIAMSTVIALSHNVFDAGILLGICDKIFPGMLMGALQFPHLPFIFVPGGPMTSGLPNREKNRIRELYAQGKISRDELLEAETKSYHSEGTCTFYGTANSNQLIAEMMGLHLPGSTFINAGTPIRHALTREAARRITTMTHLGTNYTPIGRIVSEKSVVNAIVGLLATGGSTNQTLHLVAEARAAGVRIDWDDFEELSDAVPLIVRIYPNGPGDINSFQKAGGMALLFRELLEGGLLHEDVITVAGKGLSAYTRVPVLKDGLLEWEEGPVKATDPAVISSVKEPFLPEGGLRVLGGNLGRGIMKISALSDGINTRVEAPAMVFNSQEELLEAFQQEKLDRDLIAVVRFQGPRANGMPELHKLMTPLSIAMDRGYRVGLVTDGRLSGASGKVPFVIHLSPEAATGGLLAKVKDGDIIRMDASTGTLELLIDNQEIKKRVSAAPDLKVHRAGMGRQIFAPLRMQVLEAERGACSIFSYENE